MWPVYGILQCDYKIIGDVYTLKKRLQGRVSGKILPLIWAKWQTASIEKI
jgi:hypothetical protein